MATKNFSWIVGAAALAFAGSVLAQGQSPTTGAQGSASSQSNSSVSADKSGAAVSRSDANAVNAGAGQQSASLSNGSELNATLSRPVDASKSKPGDEVTATTAKDVKSGGQVLIPRGSKLIGHVTEAKPRDKKAGNTAGAAGSAAGSAESRLGIVFDRAVLKNGREVPLNAAVQAIGAAQSSGSTDLSDVGGGASSAGGAARGTGGGALGGVGNVAGGVSGSVGGVAQTTGGAVSSTVGNSVGTITRSPNAVGGLDAAGRLDSGSKGVFGLKDFELASSSAGGAQSSIITSATRNVRLESGTSLLLVTGAHAFSSEPQNAPVK